MPAHTDFGASLTSHGPTKVFTQVKDNKRADFTIHGDDVQVVNGVILVDGKSLLLRKLSTLLFRAMKNWLISHQAFTSVSFWVLTRTMLL